MIIEARKGCSPALLLIPQNEEESLLIDSIFGDKVVDGDGLIAHVEGQVRLSDGYGDHYIRLEKKD